MQNKHLSDFKTSAIAEFKKLKALGDKSFDQLEEEHFHLQLNDESNSIAIIIQHLHGNMKSRWTDFLNSDGEKSTRDRDAEFEEQLLSVEQLMQKWNEGWEILFSALEPLTEDDFDKTIYIRSEEHSVIQAINRQLTHYGYHVGQIVYLARSISAENWESLSIPKGDSKAFNKKMNHA
jgi:hypothetical protein